MTRFAIALAAALLLAATSSGAVAAEQPEPEESQATDPTVVAAQRRQHAMRPGRLARGFGWSTLGLFTGAAAGGALGLGLGQAISASQPSCAFCIPTGTVVAIVVGPSVGAIAGAAGGASLGSRYRFAPCLAGALLGNAGAGGLVALGVVANSAPVAVVGGVVALTLPQYLASRFGQNHADHHLALLPTVTADRVGVTLIVGRSPTKSTDAHSWRE